MDSINHEITLVSAHGETIKVSQSLLEESSTYMQQVVAQSKSKVLLFPDVQIQELKDLIDHIQFGTTLQENVQVIALKYGFKSENIMTGETHLPLKKRALENTPPSSPDNHKKRALENTPPSSPDNQKLVIDENFSPSKSPSQSNKLTASNPEASLASFLPWPLLLQQAAVQKMSQCPPNLLPNLNLSSLSNLTSYPPSSLFFGSQSQSSQSVDSDSLINCEDCGKMFKPSNLNIHRRRVHRILQEPVKCCGQDFPTRWHLSEHKKSGDHLPTIWKSNNIKESNNSISTQ